MRSSSIRRFNFFHPDKPPSVIERYTKQAERVMGVLDTSLEGKKWLVGDKCTFADLSFFMWNFLIPVSMLYPTGETPLAKFPNMLAWQERMAAMDSVKKIVQLRQEKVEADGMQAAIESKDPDHWKKLGERTNATTRET